MPASDLEAFLYAEIERARRLMAHRPATAQARDERDVVVTAALDAALRHCARADAARRLGQPFPCPI